MSGPFGVSLTVISGQKHSGEIAVAAATFLSMGYMSVDPVGKDRKIRPEFLKILHIFAYREGIYYDKQPEYYAEKLTIPGKDLSTKDLFWLALDLEGEAIAKSIYEANGDLADKRIYRTVNKLNLLAPVVPPPPEASLPLQVWEETRVHLFCLAVGYRKVKGKQSYSNYMNENVVLLPEQKVFYAWCEDFYESLIPWMDTIKNIQSDYS